MESLVNGVTVLVGAGSLGYCGYLLANRDSFLRRKLRGESAKIWTKVGTLSDILIHPIKGCRAVSVRNATCTEFGAESDQRQDRRFVLYDRKLNQCFKTRHAPRCTLVDADMVDGRLVITTDNQTNRAAVVDIEAVIGAQEILDVSLYGQPISGYDCGDQVSEWLTKVIDIDDTNGMIEDPLRIRLLYHAEGLKNERVLPLFDTKWCPNVEKRNDTYAFQDATGFMLMSSSSVDQLNEWIPEGNGEHNVRQFRPNFVVSDCEPFAEDNWAEVRIGSARFSNVKPCTRCGSTQVNTETAERFANAEPLTTLRKHRLVQKEYRAPYKDKAHMGIHLSLDEFGSVAVGDDVFAVVVSR